jgi:hypothetical protein
MRKEVFLAMVAVVTAMATAGAEAKGPTDVVAALWSAEGSRISSFAAFLPRP